MKIDEDILSKIKQLHATTDATNIELAFSLGTGQGIDMPALVEQS